MNYIARNFRVLAFTSSYLKGTWLNGTQAVASSKFASLRIRHVPWTSIRPAATLPAKTAMKMFEMNSDGQITREVMEKYATEERDLIKKLDPVEAENIYKGLMAVGDAFGLDKYANDGGMSYTMRELAIVFKVIAQKDLRTINQFQIQPAYFRAIDRNGDGYIQRDEWVDLLKINKTYTSDEQAQRAFDSLDTNKDGVISMEEYVKFGTDFWCNSGESFGSQDFYGTKDMQL